MTTSVPAPRQRTGALAALVAAAVFVLSGCAAYQLPPEPGRYTFEAQTNGVTTVWQYTSAEPATAEAPEHQPFVGDTLADNKTACRREPLIFLQYDLGLALDNTAEAGGTHEITITGYYQERLSALPKVTSLKAEASFDGGKTWQPTTTRGAGKNTFSTRIKHPKRAQAVRGSPCGSAQPTVRATR
ncbi:hypothetical protein ABZY19_36905 [Streptomyces sp. NPDC006475]|uniref:hypothetical protein n=1 Tax=Streptomyces sp. NPDC006475 TaxID=3155719 RepID=UPI0033AE05AB